MQKFTYHTHTNSLNIFDGANSAKEMISKAEELGFEEIGISNHLICNPNIAEIDKYAKMYFRDYKQAADIYKRTVEDIRLAAQEHNIKVLVGFEVDFFQDKEWRNFFDKLIKEIEVDYLIGSSHFIYNNDSSNINKINYLKTRPDTLDAETINNGLANHWKNIIACINSGYFDFIAHLDQVCAKGFCLDSKWDEYKWQVIESLAKTNTAYELSTKGLRKFKQFMPSKWFVDALNKLNVPVLISDDAHHIEHIGENFELAESLLSSLNYKSRFKL